MKKIFIITGEYSGDMHASNVAKHLLNIMPDIQIEAIGGENLKNLGIKLFSDHSKMSAMGLTPKIIWNHLTLGVNLIKYLKNEYKPDLVLLIDYGVFNLKMAKHLKKAGIKTNYYIPPQVWASRKWRIKTIKKYVDRVFCIFPFEKEMYESYGINTTYCGHPLISQIPPKADKKEFFQKHELDENKKLISVFPGSRVFELKNLMPIFIKAAKILKKMHPDLQIVFSQAPSITDEQYHKYFKNTDFKYIKGENQSLLSISDALILASGTVALEASLYNTPMIIAYKGPYLFYLIYLIVRCIKRVCLANIIADKDIVPEIIENSAKPDFIAYNIEKLIYDEEARSKQIEGLKSVKDLLSDKNSAFEVASEIKKELAYE
ncbi:lipid-A-disaccharide synthase [bacterium]|nr:lipid-A-disaccharide synthase [bacterium]